MLKGKLFDLHIDKNKPVVTWCRWFSDSWYIGREQVKVRSIYIRSFLSIPRKNMICSIQLDADIFGTIGIEKYCFQVMPDYEYATN